MEENVSFSSLGCGSPGISHQTECEIFQTEVSCCRTVAAVYHFGAKPAAKHDAFGNDPSCLAAWASGCGRARLSCGPAASLRLAAMVCRGTKAARNRVTGRAFAKAIHGRSADADSVLHVSGLTGEDAYRARERCREAFEIRLPLKSSTGPRVPFRSEVLVPMRCYHGRLTADRPMKLRPALDCDLWIALRVHARHDGETPIAKQRPR